jgi:single-strand DNA-binding protein
MSELTDQIIRSSQHRFIGRMARDPDVRYFESGNCVCHARILINRLGAKRDDGQEPDGFRLEIWGEKAQAFTDATRKGDLVNVTGRVKSEIWTDRSTGEQRSGVTIQVEEWALVGQPRQAAPAAAPAKAAAPAAPAWSSTFDLSDSEVPF